MISRAAIKPLHQSTHGGRYGSRKGQARNEGCVVEDAKTSLARVATRVQRGSRWDSAREELPGGDLGCGLLEPPFSLE